MWYYEAQVLRTLQGDGLLAFVDGHRPSEAGGWWRWRGEGVVVVANTKGISSQFKTVETRSTLLCHFTPGAQCQCKWGTAQELEEVMGWDPLVNIWHISPLLAPPPPPPHSSQSWIYSVAGEGFPILSASRQTLDTHLLRFWLVKIIFVTTNELVHKRIWLFHVSRFILVIPRKVSWKLFSSDQSKGLQGGGRNVASKPSPQCWVEKPQMSTIQTSESSIQKKCLCKIHSLILVLVQLFPNLSLESL